ncbi:unnamed protein product [Allacma fusca]|uniref:Peptidase S1 domain-containing protein n=1 Tax=Allacma fusca TaxID=39272 RepID=A0A8J2NPS0_9HEXA|nr:unnamed protein product [Allacma fusca]
MELKVLLLCLCLVGSSRWVNTVSASPEETPARPPHSFFYNFFYRIYNDFLGRTNDTAGSVRNNTGRQFLPGLSPPEVLLIQQQQQRHQALALAQLNQQIIRNQNKDDDSSSEEDDAFDSEEIWGRPPPQRGVLLGRRRVPGSLGFYRSEETFDAPDAANASSNEINARQAETTEESTTETTEATTETTEATTETTEATTESTTEETTESTTEETTESTTEETTESTTEETTESTTDDTTTDDSTTDSTTDDSTTDDSTTDDSTTESTTDDSTTDDSTTESTTDDSTTDDSTTETTPEDSTTDGTDTTEGSGRPKVPPYRSSLHCRCGTQTKTEVPFGSSTLETNIYPWIVSIQTKKAHLCTGNIINSKFILTSATCVKRHRDPKKLIVEASLATPGRTKKYQVQRVIFRPDYHPTRRENDIALLEVKTAINPSKFVKFVCLPIGDKHTEGAGTLVTLTNHPKTKKLALIQELVQPVGVSRCKQLMNQNRAQLPNEAFCTASPAQHCNGDSGGSFVTRGQGYSFAIKGLIINSGCYKGKRPAVYTQVTKYMNWVLNNARNGQYCRLPNFKNRLLNLNKHNNQV